MRFFKGAERGRYGRRVGVGRWLPVVVGAMCLTLGMAGGAENEESGGKAREIVPGLYSDVPLPGAEGKEDKPVVVKVRLGETAVASALNWLYRHQDKRGGSWSFDKYQDECVDKTCTGAGVAKSDAGATGMALLCFLGAGQSHKSNGPYRRTVQLGLIWLIRHQDRDGNLAKGATSPLYSHGIATVALCEAYDMTGDQIIGEAAQKAVNYILAAQKEKDNVWRYFPDDPGGLADRSAATWQVLALRGAQLAELKVDDKGLARAGKWLDPVEKAPSDPKADAPTMIAGGLLSRQFLGVAATDTKVVEGVKRLMGNPPEMKNRNTYYWFYGTLALHNHNGAEWDTWNRALRKALIMLQVRDVKSCANGSWAPDQPAKDAWGKRGGRLMLTALSCQTLEVYYPYSLLFGRGRVYKLDAEKGDDNATGEKKPPTEPEPAKPVPAAEPSNKAAPKLPRGFTCRGVKYRKAMLETFGGTEQSERAVADALDWLSRHQLPEGNWSFDKYREQCKDARCTGTGMATADAGATGLALLCYLGAGQTHKTRGPYRRNIERGLVWLVRHQETDGNLAKDCICPMYSHGMATAALCEDFALSGDRNVGTAAQAAVNYILAAQNPNDDGWRYNPGDPGDTSVTGWQIMALRTAKMAGLNVGDADASPLELAAKWLDLVKTGPRQSQFQYQPGTGATPTMTAVGLLGRQFLHAKRDDPLMTDGVKYLMDNMPDAKMHHIYYWYYATQVLHNYGGKEWDTWNRSMRELLVSTQTRDKSSCAAGSWDPANPGKDVWSPQGGRLMLTALSCLTLEVYYRYLPLYKVEAKDHGAPPAGAENGLGPGS